MLDELFYPEYTVGSS